MSDLGVDAEVTTYGMVPYFNGAFTNTVTAVKTTKGDLYGYHVFNSGTVATYIQFFNLAVGSVTLGTTPPFMVLWLPAGGGLDTFLTAPIAFTTAITAAATTTATGLTAPVAALFVNLFYV